VNLLNNSNNDKNNTKKQQKQDRAKHLPKWLFFLPVKIPVQHHSGSVLSVGLSAVGVRSVNERID
jgi:hypothetical protein